MLKQIRRIILSATILAALSFVAMNAVNRHSSEHSASSSNTRDHSKTVRSITPHEATVLHYPVTPVLLRLIKLDEIFQPSSELTPAYDVLNNIQRWRQMSARGDERAALDLFHALGRCDRSSLGHNRDQVEVGLNVMTLNCADLSPEEATNRLSVLERSARNGSVAAQLTYGFNSQLLSGRWSAQDAQSPRVVNAIEFLESAASSGAEAAFYELIRVYGAAGSPVYDPVRAHALALVLLYFDQSNGGYVSTAQRTAQVLRTADLGAARQIAAEFLERFARRNLELTRSN